MSDTDGPSIFDAGKRIRVVQEDGTVLTGTLAIDDDDDTIRLVVSRDEGDYGEDVPMYSVKSWKLL